MVGLIGGVVSVSISREEQHAVNIPQSQLLFMSQHVCPGSHQLLITELLLHQLHGWSHDQPSKPAQDLELPVQTLNIRKVTAGQSMGGLGPRTVPRGDTMTASQPGPTSNKKT